MTSTRRCKTKTSMSASIINNMIQHSVSHHGYFCRITFQWIFRAVEGLKKKRVVSIVVQFLSKFKCGLITGTRSQKKKIGSWETSSLFLLNISLKDSITLWSLIKAAKLDTSKTRHCWGTNEENMRCTISDHTLKTLQSWKNLIYLMYSALITHLQCGSLVGNYHPSLFNPT